MKKITELCKQFFSSGFYPAYVSGTAGQPKSTQYLLLRSGAALLYSLLALLVTWIINDWFIAVLLAVVAVTVLRGYFMNWTDRNCSWNLLYTYFPKQSSADSSSETEFKGFVQYWLPLVRPVLYFFIIYKGCWYWLLAAEALSAAFAYEVSYSPALKGEGLRLWGMSAAITILALIIGKTLSGSPVTSFASGILTVIIIWLIANLVKRIENSSQNLLINAYFGEILACIAFLLGAIL